MKRIIGMLLVGLALNGCVTTTMRMQNIHPEWNPPKGQEEAELKCTESSKYAALTTNAYMVCMASYGYERRRVKR
ncbi:MAG: hypothetical protein PHV97_06255 [Candidatus Omnitrophica bacterium]|nr:hypothetical protein [Candidatus Omnitrophota bacterium]